MYKLGEYPIAAKFPFTVSIFSILFYGATKEGNLLIDLFRTDGTIISSITLTNVDNGPYYFSATTAEIAGFSLYNSDVGGLGIYQIGFSQEAANTKTWISKFDQTSTYAVTGTIANGTLYAVGYGGGFYNRLLVKVNNDGTLNWQKILTDSNYSYHSIIYNEGIGLRALGEYTLACYDLTGSLNFKRNYSGITYNLSNIDKETGAIGALESTTYKMWLGITNSTDGSLDTQITATVSGSTDHSIDCIKSKNGNIYVTGRWTDSGYTQRILLMKFNSNFSTLSWARHIWNTSYSPAFHPNCTAIDSEENMYISPDIGGRTWLIKYDSSGTLQWQRQIYYPSVLGTNIQAIDISTSNDVYILSAHHLNVPYKELLFIAKYNSSGVLQWQRTIEKTGGDLYPHGIVCDGNYIHIMFYDTNVGGCIIRMKNDGTTVGTYSNYIYAASSLTEAAGDLSYGTPPSITLETGSATSTVSTATETTGSFTTTVSSFG